MKLKISRCTVSPANRIYIVDALGCADLQTGRGKYEKIRDEVLALMPDQAKFISRQVFHVKCISLADIKSLFSSIKGECNLATTPLIFIDGHGHKQKGLVLSSGEFLSWIDLNLLLEGVTLSACGNSTVVASFCHSMTAAERLSFERPIPTPFYYGYADEVKAGVVENECLKIIEELLRTGTFEPARKTIQLYSEYDHVSPLVYTLIMKFLRPQKVANVFTDLSKSNLRASLHKDIGRDFGTTRGLNKVLAKILDPRVLIEPILTGAMHATERRDRLLKEIMDEINSDVRSSGSEKG